MGITDFVLGFGKVSGGAIASATKEVVYQVLGILGFGEEQSGEKQVGYNGLGLLGWPPPPEKIQGIAYDCDVIFTKMGDELVPIAWRDLRLNRCFPGGIKQGTIALAGYGGGFYALDLTPSASGSQKANIHTAYCPYEFDSSGVPSKAHVMFMDPDAGNMGMIHGDGFAVMIDKDNGITLRGGESTWINVKDGSVDIVAAKVNIQGIVALGSNPSAAVPITTPANPPSVTVLIAP